MVGRRIVVGLLAAAVLAVALGCTRAPAQQPPREGPVGDESKYSLDFSKVPTRVITRDFATDDPAPAESPAFRAEIVWPRLASLLTLGVWSTDWQRIRRLEQLPAEVDTLIHGTAYLDPNASKTIAAQWVDILFARDKFQVPSGLAGRELLLDEIALYCPARIAESTSMSGLDRHGCTA